MFPKTNRNLVWKYFDKSKYIAHRGLFDPATERQENSLKAFAWAVENHYPVELDVQQTSDHILVVFHDENLKRMCGVEKNVRDCTYQELLEYPLNGTKETIPLFKDVLHTLGGKVPVIVEIKSEGDWIGTTRRTMRQLDFYNGPFVVESFHPFVMGLVRLMRPSFVRGQLSTDFFIDEPKQNRILSWILTHLALDFVSAPDFVAYNCKFNDRSPLPRLRKEGKVKMVTWTVKSQQQLEENRNNFTYFIFDSFIPKPLSGN